MRDGPARPKSGRVTVFGSFIDGRPVRSDPFLGGHMRARTKWVGLARFVTLLINQLGIEIKSLL